MKKTKLTDGTLIYCLLPTEATVLDHHVAGYFSHGITLSEGATIFDVGANIGVFGIRTLQRFKGARVFAFEPVPAIYECLKANAALVHAELASSELASSELSTPEVNPEVDSKVSPERLDAFNIYRAGISDRPGELTFTYYPNSPALSTSKPEQWNESELRDAVDGSISHPPPHLHLTRFIPRPLRRLIAWWFAKRMRSGALEVSAPLMTVSEVIDAEELTQIDLLKIDCEGAEFECLLGIRADHWPLVQQVVVEVHDHAGALARMRERLNEMGLTAQVVEQEEALRATHRVNIFARRPSSAARGDLKLEQLKVQSESSS